MASNVWKLIAHCNCSVSQLQLYLWQYQPKHESHQNLDATNGSISQTRKLVEARSSRCISQGDKGKSKEQKKVKEKLTCATVGLNSRGWCNKQAWVTVTHMPLNSDLFPYQEFLQHKLPVAIAGAPLLYWWWSDASCCFLLILLWICIHCFYHLNLQ